MNTLNKLLEGVQVEWKTLGEVYKFQYGTGNTIPTSGGEYPVYGSNGVVGTHSEFNSEDSPVIGHIGAYAGIVNWGKGKHFVTYNGVICKLINENVNSRYAYYQLLKQDFNSMAKNSSQPFVSYKELNVVIIPIPPLPVQTEIVRILDTFTELTNELTNELANELTARKKQYSFYREQLFCFDEAEVQHLPLGDESIGKFIRGGGLQKKDFTETGVGCIHYGQIYTYYKTYTYKTKSFVSEEFAKKARMAKHGDVVIATTSENDEDLCKAVAWLGNEEIAVSSDACFYNHCLNPKYVAYFFQTEQFQKQKRPFITGTKVRRVNVDDLAKIIIPVPSPKEQERIVTILDKFDILTTSISEGLPKEIELRKKQYEYYRDKLLSF